MPVVHLFAVCSPVESSHDALDYLSGLSGVAGVVIALAAFIYSLVQSNRTKRDLIHERRVEFELGLLAEIRRQLSITGLQHLSGYVGALTASPSDETDLPVLRAAVGTKSTSQGRAKRDQVVEEARSASTDPQSALIRHAETEVDDAIRRRLESSDA